MLSLSERFRVLKSRLRRDPDDPPRRWMRRQWMILVPFGAAVAGIWVFNLWLGTCGFAGCPSAAAIRAFQPSEGGRILDRNGRLIGRLEVVRRVNVPLTSVPKYVQDAFIATEDRRFYEHNGLDWRAVGRALFRNVGALGIREGFSTITMQVAHNSFLATRYHGRSPLRKLIELRIARLLEHELTKDQILEHYLNVIYLGNGVNGVEAASRDLFGKSVSQISVAQGAVLAALPKAPSTYSPRHDLLKAVTRRNLVLDLMADQGYLSTRTASTAKNERLRIAADEWRPSLVDEPSAMDAVRAVVDSMLPDALKEGDVTVETTLDFTLQHSADRNVVRQAAAITAETRDTYGRVAEPAQGAYIALDPETGDIRALVTGHRTQRGQFDRAVFAKRQPGSAFKPFVYATAMHAGWAPSTIVDDEPIEVDVGRDVWTPANYNDEYKGEVTLREALENSLNAATVIVSQRVGITNIINTAHNSGIASPLQPLPSLALGAEEVTPIELVSAYAPFANGGFRIRPRLVTRILAPDGTVLKEMESAPSIPVMDPRDAYEVNSMLRAVVDFGTGRALRDDGIAGPVAGKTGTTNNGTDVWFVGFSPTLVAGVWFGYDTPRPIAENASGGRLAAPTWAEIYRTGWREQRGNGFVVPPGMVSAIIDPESGQLATDYCPHRVREWFKPDAVPQDPCALHTADRVIANDASGDANPSTPNDVDKIMQSLKRSLGRIFGKHRY
jgi:1A family penicillin-binding protein